jgi:hypothetical protein
MIILQENESGAARGAAPISSHLEVHQDIPSTK